MTGSNEHKCVSEGVCSEEHAADKCRRLGWEHGAVLVAGDGQTVYELVSIGKTSILVDWLGNISRSTGEFTPSDPDRVDRYKHTLHGWVVATDGQLAAMGVADKAPDGDMS